VHVKVIRRTEHPHQLSNSRTTFPRNIYFFYEKNTGVAHFHVEAGPDGGFPVDQAAGLLAMHCMVRGQSPSDYVVMVQAEDEALEGLSEKAAALLQAGNSVHSQLKLTRREEEVLSGLMKSLANKEIASNLNLRANRKVSCLLFAGKISSARPNGAGSRGVAPHGWSHANASSRGDA